MLSNLRSCLCLAAAILDNTALDSCTVLKNVTVPQTIDPCYPHKLLQALSQLVVKTWLVKAAWYLEKSVGCGVTGGSLSSGPDSH